MPIDFRPTELDIKCKEEIMFTMSIRHRKSGEIAAGHGDNKFALECQLLELLRQRMEKKDERATRED